MTVNHILGLEVVLHDGSVVRTGGKAVDAPGLDLTGLMVGSEGTLGIVTEVTVRLLPLPEAVRTTLALFESVEAASEAVSALIARGIVPAALEMMDKLALSAIEAAFHAGYPPEAGAVLLVEVDGLLEQVEAQAEVVDAVCREAGAISIRLAATADERARLWAARKGAASAMGRIAPNYYLHDCVVPRTRLPDILAQVVDIGQRYDLPIANLFHAGDGNLHPMILFDVRAARHHGPRPRRWPRHPERVRCRRRQHHRRAWRWPREAGVHAADLLGGRPRRHGPGALRDRSERATQSRTRSCPRRTARTAAPRQGTMPSSSPKACGSDLSTAR